MKFLVVIDMQNDFISGSLGTSEAQKIVPNVVRKIESAPKESIFVTLDTHPADYMETNEGRHLPVPHCIAGTEGHALAPEIAAALAGVEESRFLEKPTFGATALPEKLRQAAGSDTVTEIELVGLCTGICVLSNAILCKAAFPEADVSVDAACCACVTPASHDTALAAMELCQIEVRNKGGEPWRK